MGCIYGPQYSGLNVKKIKKKYFFIFFLDQNKHSTMKRSISQSRLNSTGTVSSETYEPIKKLGAILYKMERAAWKKKECTIEPMLAASSAETILKFMQIYENGSKGILSAPGWARSTRIASGNGAEETSIPKR